MSFTCPSCQSRGTLRITATIELPRDSRSDEIALQVLSCSACKLGAIGVYQESRRGALDSESVDHTGYHASQEALETLRTLIRSCPQRKNPRCNCNAHRALGEKNQHGRWIGLDALEPLDPFRLILG